MKGRERMTAPTRVDKVKSAGYKPGMPSPVLLRVAYADDESLFYESGVLMRFYELYDLVS